MRQNATNWLELAEKVEHYRRDVLSASDLRELQDQQCTVKQQLKSKANASDLKLSIERLEGTLRKSGGTLYPKRSSVEYVEFFLVAAIVILGIRAYFFQPFKIPTNSMWPSYSGMTGAVYPDEADEPGMIGQAFNFVTQMAQPRRVDAPVAGEVRVPVVRVNEKRNYVPYRTVRGKKWFVVPTNLREYELYVDDEKVSVRVPADFDLERVLLDSYFDGVETFPLPASIPVGKGVLLPTGKQVEEGDRVLAFDILTGDWLFVDRISYHFVKPSIGDGFVFRTDNIPRLHAMMPGPNEQYYIKRLVGAPGDTLEIREPVLYRNGEPIEGSDAFAKNAERVEKYPGYRYEGDMGPGQTLTVPEGQYMAFGDNSASSLDGRYWGGVPEADVAGRPLIIYYPFTKRWGRSP